MSSPDIAERMVCIIREHTSDRRRAKELEELTGIPATSWKNALSKKQRPTCHMIEAIAKQWPQYSFWLGTGLTDPAYGHSAPHTWGLHPCKHAEKHTTEAAELYFSLSQYLHYLIYGRSVAFDNYWVENKRPTEEEIKSAQELADDPFWRTSMLENEVGKVYKRKYRDLNDATTDLAEQHWVRRQMERFGLEGMDETAQRERLTQMIREQEANRLKINDNKVS